MQRPVGWCPNMILTAVKIILKVVRCHERLSGFSEVGRILSDSSMLMNIVDGSVKNWEGLAGIGCFANCNLTV